MTLEKVLLRINQWGAALILLAPILANGNFIYPFIQLKNLFFRSLISILIVTLIWYLLQSGQWRGKKNYILYGLGVFLLIQTLAAVFGVNPANSFLGSWERMDGVIHLFLVGIYFFLLVNVFRTRQAWVNLLRTGLAVSVAMGIYGLVSQGFKISDNQWSTIGNSAFLGFYLLLNIFLAGTLFLYDGESTRKKIIYGFAFLFNLAIMFGAASRAPILGLAAGLIAAGAFYWPSMSRRWKAYSLVAVAVLAIIGSTIVWQKNSNIVQSVPFVRRLAEISTSDATTHNRFLIWQSGWQSFLARPLLGYGPENIFYGLNKHYNPAITEDWFDRAHNFVIDYLNSSGILGLLAYLAVFGLAGYYLWRIRKNNRRLASWLFGCLVAYLFANLFVFDTLNSWLTVVLYLAFISFLWHNNEGEYKQAGFWQRATYPIVGLAAVVIILFAYNIIIIPARANLMAGNAYRYSGSDLAKSLDYYTQALALKTIGNREISLQLARYGMAVIDNQKFDLATKRVVFEKAETSLLDYLKDNEENIQVRLLLAQLYLAYAPYNSFYSGEVVILLEGHIADSPQRVETYFILAQAYYNQHDVNQAIAALESAYKAVSTESSVYENLLNIYSQTKNKEKLAGLMAQYLGNFSLAAEDYRKAAEYYFRVGLVDEAKQLLLEKAIPADPKSWRSYVSYGSILESEGKYAEAVKYLEQVLLEQPEFEQVVGEYIDELRTKIKK